MNVGHPAPAPTRRDALFALLIGLAALGVYWRTLAPDILYSDSAEFQTLGYTLGLAHPTGYPVYLLIVWLTSFVPFGLFAWRVNLVSALAAAGTVAGLYLLGRYLTRSRPAGVLGSLALLLSYTLWSQAIIAEIYTMGTLWVVAVTWLLWRWSRRPERRSVSLFLAAFLAGLSPGVHLYATLIAPAAVVFVWQVGRSAGGNHSLWRRSLITAVAGTVAGIAAFVAAFLLIDAINAPTSYNQVTLFASRDLWSLTLADLDSPWERLYLSFYSPQWRVAMFPGGVGFMMVKLAELMARLFAYEFSLLTLVGAAAGLILMRRRTPQQGGYVLLALLVIVFAIVNYDPGDKHIFYLPAYVFIALAFTVAAGAMLERLARQHSMAVVALGTAVLILLVGQGFWSSRWGALRDGRATFVRETYPYPLEDLGEPRRVAERIVAQLPDDALLIMGWRPLYAVAYVAHVAGRRPNLTIREATPFGSNGRVSETLIIQMEEALRAGRPVFSDRRYPNLSRHFRMRPAGADLYALTLP